MFAEIPLWVAIAAFLGGGILGTMVMAAMNLAGNEDRCHECSYVGFYQKFLRRLKDSQGIVVEKVNWFSDEMKRPSVKVTGY